MREGHHDERDHQGHQYSIHVLLGINPLEGALRVELRLINLGLELPRDDAPYRTGQNGWSWMVRQADQR